MCAHQLPHTGMWQLPTFLPPFPLHIIFSYEACLALTNPLVVSAWRTAAMRGLHALLCALQWLAWRAVTADVEAR